MEISNFALNRNVVPELFLYKCSGPDIDYFNKTQNHYAYSGQTNHIVSPVCVETVKTIPIGGSAHSFILNTSLSLKSVNVFCQQETKLDTIQNWAILVMHTQTCENSVTIIQCNYKIQWK